MIFPLTYALLWLLVIVQGLAMFVLVRTWSELQQGAPAPRREEGGGLPAGARVPTFSARDLRSHLMFESSVLRGRRAVLLFLSMDCTLCKQIAAHVGGLPQEDLADVFVYCQGNERGCALHLAALPATVPLLCKHRSDVPLAFELTAFPAAVVLDSSGNILRTFYPTKASDISEVIRRSSPVADPLLESA